MSTGLAIFQPRLDGGPALSHSKCLSALHAIEEDMEAVLEAARRARAGHCLEALRELLAPFELGRHEVVINASSGSTCLDVRVRSEFSDGPSRQLSKLRADGVVLDVLQEIDDFLQDHGDWTRLLDGEVLNPVRSLNHEAPEEAHGARGCVCARTQAPIPDTSRGTRSQ